MAILGFQGAPILLPGGDVSDLVINLSAAQAEVRDLEKSAKTDGAWHVKIEGSEEWHPVKDVKDMGPGKGNHYVLHDGRSVHQSKVKDLHLGKPLEKWERTGMGTSMVNREAHYQALAAVKDHVLKWVASMVEGMKNEEVKKIPVAGTVLTVRKIMDDMYAGTVVRGDAIIHSFDRITIPQLAGQLQSLLELYDPDKLEADADPNQLLVDKLRPIAEQAENGMVAQLIALLGGNKPPETAQDADHAEREIESLIREAQEIAEQAKAHASNPDPRAELASLRERVGQMLTRVEAAVAKLAPISGEDDVLGDTLHQMQSKHDLLTDRVQQELNILDDKVAKLSEKLKSVKGGGEKTITITVS